MEQNHVEEFGTLLGLLHRTSTAAANVLAPKFADRRFFETLRLEPYYAYTATQVPAAAQFLGTLIAATQQRRLCLVHGDYSPKNVLIYRDHLVLLDYEVVHWGDPAFDLGFSLTHLLSKAHHLAAQRQRFAVAAATYWQAYCRALGTVSWVGDLEGWAVQHTVACLLARVAGRSPLEYLSTSARARQRTAVITLLAELPTTISELINRFVTMVAALEEQSHATQ
ncbi:MAG: phosphotransferase [Caldilineaceae bacterium]